MSRRSSQHRTVVRALGLVLPLGMSCQMTSGDEVSRPPTSVRGTGGSGGRDAVADAPALDEAAPDYDAGIDTGSGVDACEHDSSCDRAK